MNKKIFHMYFISSINSLKDKDGGTITAVFRDYIPLDFKLTSNPEDFIKLESAYNEYKKQTIDEGSEVISTLIIALSYMGEIESGSDSDGEIS